MEYLSASKYFKEQFGGKIYKISLNANTTCPNRDGTLGQKGCIFCLDGSGAFSADFGDCIEKQIERGKKQVNAKMKSGKYIGYFRSYTNTYGDLFRLEELFTKTMADEEIVALSIATRPDCLGEDAMAMLCRLNEIKPLFVEVGLQTIHAKTAAYIRRGYSLCDFDDAVRRLRDAGINVIVHLIIGLPGESKEMMLQSVSYACQSGIDGMKLQLLHVLEGTDLASDYQKGKFEVLSMEEYADIICECVKIIPRGIVIHRLTGDGAKKHLLAPKWSGDKKKVLNEINRKICRI